jgi:aspartate aminotransferase-like enzyme
MAAVMAEWVVGAKARYGHELEILAGEHCRSETVTAVTLPEYLKGSEVIAAVSTKGYTLGEGYGSLRERTVRVGHMGDHTPDGLSNFLAVVDEALGEVAQHNHG